MTTPIILTRKFGEPSFARYLPWDPNSAILWDSFRVMKMKIRKSWKR